MAFSCKFRLATFILYFPASKGFFFFFIPSMEQQEFYSSSCSISHSLDFFGFVFFIPGAKSIPAGASSLQNPIAKYLGKLAVYPRKYLERIVSVLFLICRFPFPNFFPPRECPKKILFQHSLKLILRPDFFFFFLNDENL